MKHLYEAHGIDLDRAVQAARVQRAHEAAVVALNAEMAVRDQDDDDDRQMVAERAEADHQAAEQARQAAGITKREMTERRRQVITSHIESFVHEHAAIEARKIVEGALPADVATRQTSVERSIKHMQAMLAELDAK